MLNFRQRLERLIAGKPHYSILDRELIYCNSCHKKLRVPIRTQTFCIKSHEASAAHKADLVRWQNGPRQVQISAIDLLTPRLNDFTRDLAMMLVSCNIPIFKVDYRSFKDFIEKYCNKKCPSDSTLRKYYVQSLYLDRIQRIRDDIRDSWIFVQIDEARIQSRSFFSVLVGKLDGGAPKSYLIDVTEIKEAANNSSVVQAVEKALYLLWPAGIIHDNVRLLLSDQASYMLRAGKLLKETLFPRIIHVSCLCHGVHRVCEDVRKSYPGARKLIKSLTSALQRSSRRYVMLENAIGRKAPSLPVATRWGTWIKFCDFVCDHLDGIKQFAEAIKSENCKTVAPLIDALDNDTLWLDLREIKDLQSLPSTITKLEAVGLTIYEQRNLIDELMNSLPEDYKAGLKERLRKNPGYEEIFQQTENEAKNRYYRAPLTSSDVERSFSMMNNILTDRRTSLTEENFKQLAVCYLNAKSD